MSDLNPEERLSEMQPTPSAHDRLSEDQVEEAQRWGELHATPPAAAEMAQPATPEPPLRAWAWMLSEALGQWEVSLDPERAALARGYDLRVVEFRATQPPAATPAPAELFDALMDHAQAHAKNGRWTTRLVFDLIQRAYAAGQSATPAPAAEIVPLTDEREAFEREITGRWPILTLDASLKTTNGQYVSHTLNVAWIAWQARAAIATQAAPKDSKDLGVPASPSGSTLQPPSSASAAIPDATFKVGDYVLATKYCDGDPGDRWAVGFYAGMERDRHMVKDSAGKNIHVGGYRGVIRIPLAVGDWLLKNASVLESSPGGAVNLLQMVATQFNADRIEEEQE